MAVWVWASAFVAFVNIAMTLALLNIYAKNYRAIKSSFTAGLLVFAILFVVTNVAIVTLWLFLFVTPAAASIAEQAFAYMFLVNLGEALAVANLLRITWK